LPRGKGLRSAVVDSITLQLLHNGDPTIEYKVRSLLLGEAEGSRAMRLLRERIPRSRMARSLLAPPSSDRTHDGRIDQHPYRKWQGPHWTLCSLAQICYPPGDESLLPIRDQVYDWLLEPAHLRYRQSLLIPGQEDRFRRCASQEGNAIWYSILLGIDDLRTRELVQRLIAWQWPDGGWNCDKRPEARTSSVIETLIPLRALWLASLRYSDALGARAARAAERAAEFLLARSLFRRLRDGAQITKDFALIQYPIQFYDILSALQVMTEIGRIRDERCREALAILRSKRLPDGGFPLEKPNARTSASIITRGTHADWGPSGKRRMNPP
jgi:hypothetical protein